MTKKTRSIVFAGAGTAGHINPMLAIARAVRDLLTIDWLPDGSYPSSQPEATMPSGEVIHNTNRLLGRDGVFARRHGRLRLAHDLR